MRRTQKPRLSYFQAGLITLVLVGIGTYLGFTKSIPFRHHYTISAAFRTANNVKPGSFVRIAGVNVGRVVEVDRTDGDKQAAIVKMRIDDRGLPIHKDAEMAIRPRIFLEGNFFVDLKPGSPSAPVIADGDTMPINQTHAPVQLDQILTSLQAPTRKQLQNLLDELSTGLDREGGAGFNRSIRFWEPAYKNGSIVADAQLGENPHDLSGYLKSSGEVAKALNRNPVALQNLISDFDITANSLAREQTALAATIAELPRTLHAGLPALAALNDAFPHVRAFVADWRPATRSSGPAIDASTPLIRQLRGLVSQPELRGLVSDLRPTVPPLTRLNDRTAPLYEQVRLASSCQNEQILPWSHDTIQDTVFPAVGEVYVEAAKPFGGLAGESRTGDANGQWFRVLLTGGNYTYPEPGGQFLQSTAPLLGVNPPPPATKTPFKPGVPCETQQAPDLNSTPAALPPAHKVNVTDVAGYQKVVDRRQGRDQAQQRRRGVGARQGDPRRGTGGDQVTAISKHLKDFLAIIVLMVIGLGVSVYILHNQRLRFPIVEAEPFHLKAEFSTAQAVTPGQGQTIRVSGVRIGDIAKTELKDGVAIVVVRHRSEVPRPRPHRRDGAAASQDRSEGHVRRAEPGLQRRAGGQGRLDDPGPEHAARHQPRRGLPVPRRRLARLPQAAGQRRGRGPRRPRQGPPGRLPPLRADPPRPGQGHDRRRRPPQQPQAADHQAQPAQHRAGRQEQPARRPRPDVGDGLPRVRLGGAERQPRRPRPAGRAAPDDRDARQGHRLRRRPGHRHRAPAAGRREPRRRQQGDDPVRQGGRADHARQDPPVRPRRPAAGRRAAARGQEPGQGRRPT